ncbi:MAG TPA: cytochrome C-binding protein [Terriglobia bacterium]|nr:cytochrome C-binding protein [Terriglobia bacterium]
MKMHKLWRAVGAMAAGNGRFSRRTLWPRRSALGTCAALAALCAFVAVAAARTPGEKTKAEQAHETAPSWAFVVEPRRPASHGPAKPADNALRHVPGSRAAFTLRQINDGFNPPDWHPGGHPPMPEVVAHGRKPHVMACGYCHLPNGQGRPENASLAGLPAAYIVQQMADFKDRTRKTAKNTGPISAMVTHETLANKQEIRAAARYFSRLKPKPWIRVVETRTVPRTHVAGWMLVPVAGGGSVPIGRRIIETPVNLEQTEMRDDASGFIAYAPVGSIRKGKALATTGGAGTTLPCDSCHGPDLRGSGNVPTIAGRSPSYIVRQLCDFHSGARAGADAQLMQPVAAKLTVDDMVSIAAYLASLHP